MYIPHTVIQYSWKIYDFQSDYWCPFSLNTTAKSYQAAKATDNPCNLSLYFLLTIARILITVSQWIKTELLSF